MNIQLIQGEYSSSETLDLVTKLIHLKIKYHESKIANNSNDKDIKNRELKIKRLQKELYELHTEIKVTNKKYQIEGILKIESIDK